jgi:hypothetical protein
MASTFQERYNTAFGRCVRQKFQNKMMQEWPVEIFKDENPNNLKKVKTFQQACNMLSYSLSFGPLYKGEDVDGYYYPGNNSVVAELQKLFDEIENKGLPQYFDLDAELLLDSYSVSPQKDDEDSEEDDDDYDGYYNFDENIYNIDSDDIKKALFGNEVVENFMR